MANTLPVNVLISRIFHPYKAKAQTDHIMYIKLHHQCFFPVCGVHQRQPRLKQMARLCLTAVLLAVLLSAQHSQAVVNKNDLARFVADLLNVYKPTYRVQGEPPMFAVALSIPLNSQNLYDFQQVTTADPPQNVRNSLDRCQVYTGTRVVAATLLKWPDVINQCPNEPVGWDYVHQMCPNARTWGELKQQCTSSIEKRLKRMDNGLVDHAEYRVLANFNTLLNRINQGIRSTDLMLFYVYKAPCDSRCSSTNNRFNILQQITSIRRWNNYAVVFSNIFVPVRTTLTGAQLEQNRRNAIMNLGNVINGVGNIYRCIEGTNQCSSCNAPGGVNNECVQNSRSHSAPPTGH